MALTTKQFGGRYVRLTDQSDADTALTLSTPTDVPLRVLYVAVKYSGTATHAGVTKTLNSGAGEAWDTLLHTGASDEEDHFWQPTRGVELADGDALDVAAPAGGAGVTSQITVVAETL